MGGNKLKTTRRQLLVGTDIVCECKIFTIQALLQAQKYAEDDWPREPWEKTTLSLNWIKEGETDAWRWWWRAEVGPHIHALTPSWFRGHRWIPQFEETEISTDYLGLVLGKKAPLGALTCASPPLECIRACLGRRGRSLALLGGAPALTSAGDPPLESIRGCQRRRGGSLALSEGAEVLIPSGAEERRRLAGPHGVHDAPWRGVLYRIRPLEVFDFKMLKNFR